MKGKLRYVFLIIFFLSSYSSFAQSGSGYQAIYSGVPWFDDHGNIVSAHAAGITRSGGRYYLFGEKHIDSNNAFAGFTCYSSADLCNWKFESMALPVQDSGRLGANRVGERPKVMHCPKTGEYVMFMHTDDLNYKDQCVGYATSKNITGPYTFRGQLLFNGKPIKKWDMGTFQDTDGSGYVLTHGGEVYKLNDDYLSITEHMSNQWAGSEAPAVFKKNGVYFWLTSHLTSWERNDNYYFTAPSMKGPWTSRGIFAPAGSLTWNSQTTFVLPVEGSKDTTFMFMGDRWSYPLQASSASYVWQPLLVSGTTISMLVYHEAWQVNTSTGTWSAIRATKKMISNIDKRAITYSGKWQSNKFDTLSTMASDVKDASFTVKFSGTQVGFYGEACKTGGYARVILQDNKGKNLFTAVVDMYCSYPTSGLRFLGPLLKKGEYKLSVFVMGEHSKWSDKRKADYGSTGDLVALDKVVVNE